MAFCDLGKRCPNLRLLGEIGELEEQLEQSKERIKTLTEDFNYMAGISKLSKKVGLAHVEQKRIVTSTTSTQTYASFTKSRFLLLKLFYRKLWFKNYEKALKRMLKIRLALRASAEPKTDQKKRDGHEGKTPSFALVKSNPPFSPLQTATMNAELKVIHKKIEGLETSLQVTRLNSEAQLRMESERMTGLRDFRTEFEVSRDEARRGLWAIQKDIEAQSSELASLRKENFDLVHTWSAKPILLPKPKVDVVIKTLDDTAAIKEEAKQKKRMEKEERKRAKEIAKAERRVEKRKELNQMPGLKGLRDLVGMTNEGIQKLREDMEETIVQNRSAVRDVEDRLRELQLPDVADRVFRADDRAKKLNADLEDLRSEFKAYRSEAEANKTVLIDARVLITELSSITTEKIQRAVEEKERQRASDRIESEKLRRLGSSKQSAQRIIDRRKTDQIHKEIGLEMEKATPKIVSFVREWNSLIKGDLVRYNGQVFTVDEEFNPSIRVKHSGQNGDKWEAQKFANTYWIGLGYH